MRHAPAKWEFDDPAIVTPAFVYDQARIADSTAHVCRLASECGCKVLYALKAFSEAGVLRQMAGVVAGFAASSPFEAILARDVLAGRGTVHLTSPGLDEREISRLDGSCDYVSFNSLSQLSRLRSMLGPEVKRGLRVNPQLSFVVDDRHNPCRPGSKLGVPVADLSTALGSHPTLLDGIGGLHFHSNCDSSDLQQLHATMDRLHSILGPSVFAALQWVNMGGGYLFQTGQNLEGFRRAIDLVEGRYGLQVFIEPGATLVRDAGYLVATVVDLFESDNQSVAVLDTTVNHLPEVFEYQCGPDALGDAQGNPYTFVLAGTTCMAGDVFGKYSFAGPLGLGSRIVFANVGAYSLVKAHRFNGINLPNIYSRGANGGFVLKKQFSYGDFALHNDAVAE